MFFFKKQPPYSTSTLNTVLVQGRCVSLTGFWFSDQKQIEKIYRDQIQLEIGLNSLFSTKGDLCPSSDDFEFSTMYTGYCT
jgi:hypothetical protein